MEYSTTEKFTDPAIVNAIGDFGRKSGEPLPTYRRRFACQGVVGPDGVVQVYELRYDKEYDTSFIVFVDDYEGPNADYDAPTHLHSFQGRNPGL